MISNNEITYYHDDLPFGFKAEGASYSSKRKRNEKWLLFIYISACIILFLIYKSFLPDDFLKRPVPFYLFNILLFILSMPFLLVILKSYLMPLFSKTWPRVEATIIKLNVEKDGHNNWPTLVYQYMVDNHQYISERIFFANYALSYEEAFKIVTRWDITKNTIAYHHPYFKFYSVLDRDNHRPPLWICIFAFILIVLSATIHILI